MGFRLTPRSMTLDDLELLQGQILSEFRVISRLREATLAKRMKIRLKLLLMTNMKSHMGFRLAPRSMTLDDLELL